MSEATPIDLPVGLRWVKLVCRLGRLVTDSAYDADPHPDLLPVRGTLTLTTSPNRLRIQEADGQWRSVEAAGREYNIRADGELVDDQGRVGVWMPDPASLLVEPQGYAVTAAVKPTGGTGWSVTIGGSTVLPDVVDLVAVSSVGPISPNVTASFDARVYALEQGSGVDVSQAVEDYLTANPPAGGGGSGVTATDAPTAPTEGQSASYLVTSAVTWPAGLVWSDDPDGGTAPTITGTALVSLFTVGGITRAIMGATFPALPPPPDTTNPTAGTLASSAITATGFTLTVSGAADAGGLHAQPYSFDTGTGTFGAWQTAASLAVTGKTAGTAYTCRHKVRDAAGNESTGSSITVTTTAVDTTNPAAGTLGVVVGSTTADLTVTGASDETALHATPYAYSSNNGSTWTAYQAGATHQFTGLTPSTSYTFRHRVRDAAGNVSTGTAVTESTDAPPADTTPPTVGTMAASAITETGFTLTVSGASDAVGLHAQPYAFTTDSGTTWSAYQASPVYAATGLTAETAYSVNWRVRDAAGNASTGTAQTVTTTSSALVGDVTETFAYPAATTLTGLTTTTGGLVWARDTPTTGPLIGGTGSEPKVGANERLVAPGTATMPAVLTLPQVSASITFDYDVTPSGAIVKACVASTDNTNTLLARIANGSLKVYRSSTNEVYAEMSGIATSGTATLSYDAATGAAEVIINGTSVWTGTYAGLSGTIAGVLVQGAGAWVDNVRIEYL